MARIGLACFCLTAECSLFCEDTFEPSQGLPPTRHDDPAPGFGLDVQWRPRVGVQAASFSTTRDPILGNALGFHSSGALFMMAQWDADAADGIASGDGQAVGLGTAPGDRLRFSLNLRTTNVFSSGGTFRLGLYLDPDGPLAADPAQSTWTGDARGYFLQISARHAGPVLLGRELGDKKSPPFQGLDVVTLSPGLQGALAVVGADTLCHTLIMELTRRESGVQVDVYWDGRRVSSAMDAAEPIVALNSLFMQGAAQNPTEYVFDNLRLETLPAAASGARLAMASGPPGEAVLRAAGGPGGGACRLLASAEIGTAAATWVPVATNLFDDDGGCVLADVFAPAATRRFYRLEVLPANSAGASNGPVPPFSYGIYAGNTHAHTHYTSSHGDQVSNNDLALNGAPAQHHFLARAAGYDFYTTTDHSNEAAFEPTSLLNPAWVDVRHQAAVLTDDRYVGLAGYEHTEPGLADGLGHFNVINSSAYLDAQETGVDLPYFYHWLKTVPPHRAGPGVVSFNHPAVDQYENWGHRDPEITDIITLLEVINSNTRTYEKAFQAALDHGWKVSPVCGNDNHGFRGITNHTARTFVLATNRTPAAILDAMKQRRTYAARDSNIQIRYSVNGAVLGSTLDGESTFHFDIRVSDPDTNDPEDRIAKIEIVRDGGLVLLIFLPFPAHSLMWKPVIQNATSRYFYVRVTNRGGSTPMAWAAPVWTGR